MTVFNTSNNSSVDLNHPHLFPNIIFFIVYPFFTNNTQSMLKKKGRRSRKPEICGPRWSSGLAVTSLLTRFSAKRISPNSCKILSRFMLFVIESDIPPSSLWARHTATFLFLYISDLEGAGLWHAVNKLLCRARSRVLTMTHTRTSMSTSALIPLLLMCLHISFRHPGPCS